MTWEEGRRLVSANNGTTNLTFTYDSEGLRLSKTVGTTEHKCYYAGGKLLRETWGSNTLDFFYDAMGTPYAVKYNGTLYYYITNLQGDILHIVDASGATVVSYTYSPYGKVLSTTGTLADTLGADNPLRYRGYYNDTEASLYYLQSRYYDPELCRFINADSYASTGQGIIGHNMFTYCGCNPISRVDPFGGAWCNAASVFDPQIGGDGQQSNDVLVLSIGSEGWMDSSYTMGRVMAMSLGLESYTVIAVTEENFAEIWKNATSKYVIIHTHGSPSSLAGDDWSFKVNEMEQMKYNCRIQYIMMTACETGRENGAQPNVGQTLSTKINPNGRVICATTLVNGADRIFTPDPPGCWIVYSNGCQLDVSFPNSMTMRRAAKYFSQQ